MQTDVFAVSCSVHAAQNGQMWTATQTKSLESVHLTNGTFEHTGFFVLSEIGGKAKEKHWVFGCVTEFLTNKSQPALPSGWSVFFSGVTVALKTHVWRSG